MAKDLGGEKYTGGRQGRKQVRRIISERHEMAYLDSTARGDQGGRFGRRDTRIGPRSEEFFVPSQWTKRARNQEDVVKHSWDDVETSNEEECGHGPVRYLTADEITRDYGHVNGKICVPPEKRWGAYVKCLIRECKRHQADSPKLKELLKKPHSYPERLADWVVEELERALEVAKGSAA